MPLTLEQQKAIAIAEAKRKQALAAGTVPTAQVDQQPSGPPMMLDGQNIAKATSGLTSAMAQEMQKPQPSLYGFGYQNRNLPFAEREPLERKAAQDTATIAARYGAPIGAMFLGGPGASILTASALGALGGAAGEAAAQAIEVGTGDRESVNPRDVAASAVLGATPVSQSGSLLLKTAANAGYAGSAAILSEAVRTGELNQDAALASGGMATVLNILGGLKIRGSSPERIAQKIASGEKLTSAEQRALNHAQRDKTLQLSKDAGYMVPPSAVRESGAVMSALEGLAGKSATDAEFVIMNHAITQDLVRKNLGLPRTDVINMEALKEVREKAGEVYGEIAAISPKLSESIQAFKEARDTAKALWRASKTGANPAKAIKQAKKYDEEVSAHMAEIQKELQAQNRPKLFQQFQDARKTIAKVHVIEDALTDSSGEIAAQIIAKADKKNPDMLDGELKTIANFANTFKRVSKRPSEVDTTIPFRPYLGLAVGGTAGVATQNPLLSLGLAAGSLYAPKAARKFLSSNIAQTLFTNPSYRSEVLSQDALSLLTKTGMLLQAEETQNEELGRILREAVQ